MWTCMAQIHVVQGSIVVKTFGGLLDIGCLLTLTSRDPKYHCGPCARVGDYGGEVINGVSAQVHLKMGPVGPLYPSCSYFPVPEFITRTHIVSNWQNPHTGSQPCGHETRRGQVEAIRTASIQENSTAFTEKQQIRGTIEDLKNAGLVIPTMWPFSSPIWPVRKQETLENDSGLSST